MWKQTLLAAMMTMGVIGCASERHPEIPPTAVLAAEGNRDLTYQAPAAGMIYVFDTQHNRMVYAGDIARGQSINVNHQTGTITIDGRTVSEKALHAGEQHRIFFKAAM